MPFPRIFHYSRCSPLKSFISTVHPPIPLYKIRFLLSFFLSPQPPLSLSFLEPIVSFAFIFFISFRSVKARCSLCVVDIYKAVFKIFTGNLRLRPSAMGFTDCSRRRSSSMAGCSFCTRSTQPAEI